MLELQAAEEGLRAARARLFAKTAGLMEAGYIQVAAEDPDAGVKALVAEVEAADIDPRTAPALRL